MLTLTRVVPILAAGTILLGSIHAQQTPAAKTDQTAPAKAQAAPTTKKATTAKTPATTKSAPVITLKTPKEKLSYALGMSMGARLHQQSVEVDPNIMAMGLKAALAGGKTLLTQEEAQAAIVAAQNGMRAKLKDANEKEGQTFLAANKSKEGIVTLPSGLQYKILKAGTGPKPTASDSVVCNYKGTFINGTEFDSSYKRGQPATFPVGGVIKGWTEALQLMPVGSQWQLFVPASLAYGENGMGGAIAPGTTLLFEVELLSIQEKPKAEDKPKVEGAPKTDDKPKLEDKPKVEDQPKPEDKPKAEDKQ
jgi:FKBP-type peptidyl-prolyl cis-trans isomerase FklB